MRNLLREYGQKTWVSGGQDSLDIPRDYAINDIMLEFAGSIIVSGGTTNGTPKSFCPAGLVKQLDLRANGRDTIKSMAFEDIVAQTTIRYGTLPNNTLMTSGAQATYPYYIYGIMNLAMWGTVKPFDTLFNANPLTSLTLQITWGVQADLYTSVAGDRTHTITGTLSVLGKEVVGVPSQQLFIVFKEATINAPVAASSSEFKIPLNYARDLSYRGLTLRARVDGAEVNTVVNNIKLQSGGVIFINVNGRRLAARNKSMFSLETWLTGFYVIDFCEDGRIGDSLDTSGLSSLDLILDVTKSGTTCEIKVITQELIVPTVVKSA